MSSCAIRMCSSSCHGECSKPAARAPRLPAGMPSTAFSNPTCASSQSSTRTRCSRNASIDSAPLKAKRVLEFRGQLAVLGLETKIAAAVLRLLDPALAEREEQVVPRLQRPADAALPAQI